MVYKYGLLKYETRNLGDEIQSLSARKFLPRVDIYVDREHLNSIKSDEKIKLIMNGWFMHKPENWPPSQDIYPLFISFHISPRCSKEMTSPKFIEYFKKYEPIGCRDYYTRALLRSKGVDAYFSGCLTLTLDRRTSKRSNEILIADLDEKAINAIPPDILTEATILTHFSHPLIRKLVKLAKGNKTVHAFMKKTKLSYPLDRFVTRFSAKMLGRGKKFKEAEKLLDRYARAKLVITSRLHCALPRVAFNAPVIFVHENLEDLRFGGLLEYLRSYSLKEFIERVHEIDWDNLPKNLNRNKLRKLRRNLIKTCEEFIKDC